MKKARNPASIDARKEDDVTAGVDSGGEKDAFDKTVNVAPHRTRLALEALCVD